MPDITQPFQTFVDSLNSANVKKIFGDPIAAEGRTIIPVAKVSYGFGGGSQKTQTDGDGQQQPGQAESGPVGMGGGGGVSAQPLGVVEVTKDETRYISIHPAARLMGAAALGLFVGLWMRR